jgi:hypothetical protein
MWHLPSDAAVAGLLPGPNIGSRSEPGGTQPTLRPSLVISSRNLDLPSGWFSDNKNVRTGHTAGRLTLPNGGGSARSDFGDGRLPAAVHHVMVSRVIVEDAPARQRCGVAAVLSQPAGVRNEERIRVGGRVAGAMRKSAPPATLGPHGSSNRPANRQRSERYPHPHAGHTPRQGAMCGRAVIFPGTHHRFLNCLKDLEAPLQNVARDLM